MSLLQKCFPRDCPARGSKSDRYCFKSVAAQQMNPNVKFTDGIHGFSSAGFKRIDVPLLATAKKTGQVHPAR